jgi:DNA polymerase III epsilon subunit-like protein
MNGWVLVDTETDGLEAPIHAVEVAAQRFKGFEPFGEPLRVFINHGIEIPPAATAVHGYTTEFINENGVSPQAAYEQIGDYISGAPIAAHYLGFDWNRVLSPEWERLGIAPLGQRGFCTWKLARRSLPELPTHKLDFLREQFDLSCSRAHSALGDIESVADLLTRVVFPRLVDKGLKTLDDVVAFTLLPPLRCRCVIQGLNYDVELARVEEEKERQRADKKAKREEEKARDRFISDVESGRYPLPDLIRDFDLIAEDPIVYFQDRVFLFTGKMKWGTRPDAERLVAGRGGSVSKSKTVSSSIDYLVLGEDLEAGWTKLLHGGKLVQAFLKKLKGAKASFQIILEDDFVHALNSPAVKPPTGESSAGQRILKEKRAREERYAALEASLEGAGLLPKVKVESGKAGVTITFSIE